MSVVVSPSIWPYCSFRICYCALEAAPFVPICLQNPCASHPLHLATYHCCNHLHRRTQSMAQWYIAAILLPFTATAQQRLHLLTSSNSRRRVALEQLSQQTATARSEVLGNTLPTVLRYQSLTLSHVGAMLAREQRGRLRELMEILPLRINAVRSSGGPIQITVCNVRLPENASAPAGGWSEPQVRARASLGTQ